MGQQGELRSLESARRTTNAGAWDSRSWRSRDARQGAGSHASVPRRIWGLLHCEQSPPYRRVVLRVAKQPTGLSQIDRLGRLTTTCIGRAQRSHAHQLPRRGCCENRVRGIRSNQHVFNCGSRAAAACRYGMRVGDRWVAIRTDAACNAGAVSEVDGSRLV